MKMWSRPKPPAREPPPFKPGMMGSTLALIATIARGYDNSGHPERADELLADLHQGIGELIAARSAKSRADGR